jgi:hypothetical protein
MKLYEVPRNTRIRAGNTELDFKHIDGMYSLCYMDNGDIIHLHSSTEVEVIEDETSDTEF